MNPGKEPARNRPAEEGRKHNPDLRDNSAAQPGASTMSDSPTDNENQKVTRTAADNFREQNTHDEKADADLDDIDND